MTLTEPISAASLQPTVLAEHLAAEAIPYRGALTPRQLDAPEAETGALLQGAAVHDLGWLRRIAVRGEDRLRWLSGMVTNAVETLEDRHGAYNLILNAQGRIQGDCWVWRDGEEIELEVTAEQQEAVAAHLDRFIIMDDVELVPATEQSALGITGPEAGILLARIGLPAPPDELSSAIGAVEGIPVRVYRCYGPAVAHYALWTDSDRIPALWRAIRAAGATAAGADSVETLRVAEGIPAYGIDIQSRDLPQETSQLRAISFTKGCYLGQEIVERIRSRGQVHRHLRALEVTPEDGQAPPAGQELRIAGAAMDAKAAATLTSVASLQLEGRQRIFAIGMVRAEAQAGKQPLVYPGGTATILHAPPKLSKPKLLKST